jgi:hypothetical protein
MMISFLDFFFKKKYMVTKKSLFKKGYYPFEDFSPLKKLAPNIIGKQIFQFLIFGCVNIRLRHLYIYIYIYTYHILIWWISQKSDIHPT